MFEGDTLILASRLEDLYPTGPVTDIVTITKVTDSYWEGESFTYVQTGRKVCRKRFVYSGPLSFIYFNKSGGAVTRIWSLLISEIEKGI